jgi:hypothetical protein
MHNSHNSPSLDGGLKAQMSNMERTNGSVNPSGDSAVAASLALRLGAKSRKDDPDEFRIRPASCGSRNLPGWNDSKRLVVGGVVVCGGTGVSVDGKPTWV